MIKSKDDMMNKRILLLGLVFGMVLAAVKVSAQTATIQLIFNGSETPAKVYIASYDVLNDKATRDSLIIKQGRAQYRFPLAGVAKITLYEQVRDRDKLAVFYVKEGETLVTIPDALPDIIIQNSPI